jgi:hypothetical protein
MGAFLSSSVILFSGDICRGKLLREKEWAHRVSGEICFNQFGLMGLWTIWKVAYHPKLLIC